MPIIFDIVADHVKILQTLTHCTMHQQPTTSISFKIATSWSTLIVTDDGSIWHVIQISGLNTISYCDDGLPWFKRSLEVEYYLAAELQCAR